MSQSTNRTSWRHRFASFVSRRIWLVSLAGLAVSALLVLIGAQTSGFLPNLLAEGVGLFAGVAVAVALVEPLMDRHRMEEWRLVRARTLRSICVRLSYIGSDLNRFLSPKMVGLNGIVDSRTGPNAGTHQGFLAVADDVQAAGRNDEVEAVYREIKGDLDAIRFVLTPRVFASEAEPALAVAPGEFDDSVGELENALCQRRPKTDPLATAEN